MHPIHSLQQPLIRVTTTSSDGLYALLSMSRLRQQLWCPLVRFTCLFTPMETPALQALLGQLVLGLAQTLLTIGVRREHSQLLQQGAADGAQGPSGRWGRCCWRPSRRQCRAGGSCAGRAAAAAPLLPRTRPGRWCRCWPRPPRNCKQHGTCWQFEAHTHSSMAVHAAVASARQHKSRYMHLSVRMHHIYTKLTLQRWPHRRRCYRIGEVNVASSHLGYIEHLC
jgi:hypothetical protein